MVTLGSSAGGYAAVRAAVELPADEAVAWSPQVLLDPSERRAAQLPRMAFDSLLHAVREVARLEGLALPSLCEAVRRARPPLPAVRLHVGALERGDVAEAALLRAAESSGVW